MVEWVVYIVECTWLGIWTTRDGRTSESGRSVEAVKSIRDCAWPILLERNECCDVEEMVGRISERWVLVEISNPCCCDQ
jgi:hypothetical protein